MTRSAETLERIVASVGAGVASTSWRGQDAQRFSNTWDGNLKGSLLGVARSLNEAGRVLARNADEQEDASSANGPSAGPGTVRSVPRTPVESGRSDRSSPATAEVGEETTSAGTTSSGGSELAGPGGVLEVGVMLPKEREWGRTWSKPKHRKDEFEPSAKVEVASGEAGVGPSVESKHGSYRAGIHGETDVYVGTDGIAVDASVMVGVQGELHGSHQLGDHAEVSGKVSGTVGGEAEASLTVGSDGVFTAEAGAFAGGRGRVEGGVEFSGMGAGVNAEGWVGAGIEGGAAFGWKDGKLQVSLSGGAALGAGGKVGFDFEVDPDEVLEGLREVGESIDEIWPW